MGRQRVRGVAVAVKTDAPTCVHACIFVDFYSTAVSVRSRSTQWVTKIVRIQALMREDNSKRFGVYRLGRGFKRLTLIAGLIREFLEREPRPATARNEHSPR